MRFQEESFSLGLMEEMEPLWKLHYKEVVSDPLTLDIDLNVYARAHSVGSLRIYTVRLVERLVGYNVFFVTRHPHWKGSLQAIQDAIYLRSDTRDGWMGYRFIKWCDTRLKYDGVERVYQHFSVKRNLGKMLKRLGYEPMDEVYVKAL